MRWLMIGAAANTAVAAVNVVAAVQIDRRQQGLRERPLGVSDPPPRESGDGLRARQLQALMIHDNVVQGLVTAKLSLELGETESGMAILEETLGAAQRILGELHDGLDAEGLRQALRRPGTPARPVTVD